MKKLIILMLGMLILCVAVSAYAVDSNKPDDHNANWEQLHGKKANRNNAECYMCHEEKAECITCHQDTKPRNHTLSWSNKTHGMEARWDRQSCKTCHTEDSCMSCHESTMPSSHRGNFRDSHCNISCQMPVGRWKNTISKDCIVCHQSVPSATHVRP